jgi:hypothetical protein
VGLGRSCTLYVSLQKAALQFKFDNQLKKYKFFMGPISVAYLTLGKAYNKGVSVPSCLKLPVSKCQLEILSGIQGTSC